MIPIMQVRFELSFVLLVVSSDNSIPHLQKKPLQVSFTVEHTDSTQIYLEVTVSSPATVWCGAWSFGELIDFITLQQLSPGLSINRTINALLTPKVAETTSSPISTPPPLTKSPASAHTPLSFKTTPISQNRW